MYKFKSEECLIDRIYQMAMLLRRSGVVPVFVFDGKPPQEKIPLLKQRRDDKKRAELEMISMQQKMKNKDANIRYSDYIECKRKSVRIRKKEIEEVKQLLTLCGITWYQAEGEADELCARLILKKRVWACMSEDMDMFVYGCPRVLRCFHLMRGTCLLYDTNAILDSLGLTMNEFREICVVSGSDYTAETRNRFTLYEVIKSFESFKNEQQEQVTRKAMTRTHTCFYEWLDNKGLYKDNIYQLYAADLVFDTSSTSLINYDANPITNNEIQEEDLRKFLWQYNFVFPQ
jgi:5'-3' exonuclease